MTIEETKERIARRDAGVCGRKSDTSGEFR